MDDFYHKLAIHVMQMHSRQLDNKEYLSRILDAKQAIKEQEPIADDDLSFIDNLLDDTLKLTAIINDNFESYEKFMNMYTGNHGRLQTKS